MRRKRHKNVTKKTRIKNVENPTHLWEFGVLPKIYKYDSKEEKKERFVLGPCGTFAVPFELHSMCAMSRGRVIVPFMFRQGTKIDVLKYIGNIITSLGVF